MPEDPRDDDKFVEEVFSCIRTKNSARFAKELTGDELEQEPG